MSLLALPSSSYDSEQARKLVSHFGANFEPVTASKSLPKTLSELMKHVFMQDPHRCDAPYTSDIHSIFTFSYLLHVSETEPALKRLWQERVQRDLHAQTLAIKIEAFPTPPTQPKVVQETFQIARQILPALKLKLEKLVTLLDHPDLLEYPARSGYRNVMLEMDREVSDAFNPICSLLSQLVNESPHTYFFRLRTPIQVDGKIFPNLTWHAEYLYLLLLSLSLLAKKDSQHAAWVSSVQTLLQNKHSIKCHTSNSTQLLQCLTFD